MQNEFMQNKYKHFPFAEDHYDVYLFVISVISLMVGAMVFAALSVPLCLYWLATSGLTKAWSLLWSRRRDGVFSK